MQPIPNAELVCISDFPIATYSGMMPGVLSGQYSVSDMEIDLVRLCNSAGSRLIIGNVIGLDLEDRMIQFENRPPLSYELLSIGIGSRPTFRGVQIEDDSNLLAIKPMQSFLERFEKRVEELSGLSRPAKIAIIGGGLGSIEVAFCLKHRLANDPVWKSRFKAQPDITLVTGSESIGTGLLPSTVKRVKKQFSEQGVQFREKCRVVILNRHGFETQDGQQIEADIVIWATNAVGPPLLGELSLETDNRGFLTTRPTLQTTSDDNIFAVGDSGTIKSSETPKAGVFAVRQGPFLWENLKLSIARKQLRKYTPQSGFMKLINIGNDEAVMEYKGLSFEGKWCWRIKDRIDRKFMAMYQDYSLMEMKPEPVDEETIMRCLGCGGKIGGQILSQVLAELDVPKHPDVVIGLDQPDDAAVIRTHGNQVTVTTDFFASPFDDPFLVGRVAMLNSASDCFVMGAQPTSALAIVQLPLGHPRAQVQVMRELMAGSVVELKKMGATLVGGHSIEGPRTTIGFTVLGNQLIDPKTKGQLVEGDHLVLTKPIGTGVLLAALMQSKMDGWNYHELMDSMLQSNQIALQLIGQHPITAITDVTGFGLAGHLIEMLKASSASAQVNLRSVRLLSGVASHIAGGLESTLADENRMIRNRIRFAAPPDDETRLIYDALFDPQTGGGLLFGVADSALRSTLSFLHGEGFEQAVSIGRVVSSDSKGPSVSFV